MKGFLVCKLTTEIFHPTRSVPVAQKTVLSFLFSVNIEVINLITTQASLLVLFSVTVSRFNFFIAQGFMCIAVALGCVVCEFFIAISVTKLLLVTHFSRIFPFDPSRLGSVITIIAIVLAFLPCTAVGIYEAMHGDVIFQPVAYLTGLTICYQGMPILHRILTFWIVLALCTLVLTLLCISHKLKQQGLSQAIKAGERNVPRNEINLKKILVGFCAFIFHISVVVLRNFTISFQDLPVNFFSAATSLNLMLFYFILEDNVWKFLKIRIPKSRLVIVAFIWANKVTPEPFQAQV
jgi:hypothetical protein